MWPRLWLRRDVLFGAPLPSILLNLRCRLFCVPAVSPLFEAPAGPPSVSEAGMTGQVRDRCSEENARFSRTGGGVAVLCVSEFNVKRRSKGKKFCRLQIGPAGISLLRRASLFKLSMMFRVFCPTSYTFHGLDM